MTYTVVRIRRDTYMDSVLLMEATRSMESAPGVDWATATMGTPANVDVLKQEGFDAAELSTAGANDLILAIRADSEEQGAEAIRAAEATLARDAGRAGGGPVRRAGPPRSIHGARVALAGANVAVISVPGPYAALEAHKALGEGLHVLLFSDNVSLEDEVALKARAEELGLLVMGPGAGTAMLGGVGLGFATVVRRGRVGVAAAAGTGAQEVMSLLDRWGAGVSQVIGVGGRDLSAEVGGRMMRMALRALEGDVETDVILIVSKPPAPEVAQALLREIGRDKPVVAAFIGLQERPPAPSHVRVVGTMEEAALASLEALGLPLTPAAADIDEVGRGIAVLPAERHAVRGLFSGGTLCYEAMHILASSLGPIYSNTPLRPEWALPAPPDGHVCLDLGEEEYTRGRPHPMIDPGPRAELIAAEGEKSTTAVILIDVVLGYGAHPDPASALAPPCADIVNAERGIVVVAYVLGTAGDPQSYSYQCEQLQDAGCLIAPTATAGAYMAAALASRNLGLVEGRHGITQRLR